MFGLPCEELGRNLEPAVPRRGQRQGRVRLIVTGETTLLVGVAHGPVDDAERGPTATHTGSASLGMGVTKPKDDCNIRLLREV